jgi:hypothetical protein
MQHHHGLVHFPVHERHNNLLTALCTRPAINWTDEAHMQQQTNAILTETECY